jgi:molecular chaperone GrpE
MSSDRPWSSPATGADPSGGSASGAERPADSVTGPDSDTQPSEKKSGAVADSDAFTNDWREEVPESASPSATDEMEDPVAVAVRERNEYKDALIRLQADFENYKKRMIKQQTDHLERAAESLVDKLLPVLDTADLALAHGGGEDVKQVTAAITGVLEREGLERIDPIGDPFDPTLHDAVAHEPGDGDGQQEVVEVLRAGYRWKGRVLRPAMVKVRG